MTCFLVAIVQLHAGYWEELNVGNERTATILQDPVLHAEQYLGYSRNTNCLRTKPCELPGNTFLRMFFSHDTPGVSGGVLSYEWEPEAQQAYHSPSLGKSHSP